MDEYHDRFERVREEVGKAVIGYEDIVDDFLIGLMTGGHILLEGMPGIAKTTMIKVFSKAVGLEYGRIQFTQDLLPSDITGHYYFDQRSGWFELRKGPVFAHVLMADEINRAPPKTQSAMIEAMQEGQVTIEGTTLSLPDPFLVIATRNPIETEGVYPLPEAQLDRFLIKGEMAYLPQEEERRMLRLKSGGGEDLEVRTVEDGFGFEIRDLHREAHVSESVIDYIGDIVFETREVDRLVLGASPRASEHLLNASRAYAVLQGRDYVLPDDVKEMAARVLPHRLILSIESELEGVTAGQVLDEILEERVEAPKGDFVR
ncbi:MAG: AAA family ATPase [Methanomassiliicoccales archaeon]